MERRPGQIQQKMFKDRTRLRPIQTDGEGLCPTIDGNHGTLIDRMVRQVAAKAG